MFKSKKHNHKLVFFLLFFVFISIMKTYATWEIIQKNFGDDWVDVFFLDKDRGWAIGEHGAVLGTENGGNDWKLLKARKNGVTYHAAYFVTEKKGWIVGEDYKSRKVIILFTENGGKSLKEQAKFPGDYLTDVYFSSQKEGWVVGSKNKRILILHTENGGEDWEIQKDDELGYLFKVLFINEKKGFAVGGKDSNIPLIFQTTDGGKRWNKQSIPINVGIGYDIFFLNPLEGFLTFGKSLLKTIDGGTSWQQVSIPNNVVLTAVLFKNSKEGFLIGGKISSPCSGLILHTEDGCQSFDWQTGFSILNAIGSFGRQLWIVGNDNTIIHSQDSKSWHPQVEKAYTYLDIDFVKKNRGFLLGLSNRRWNSCNEAAIFYTYDGGKHWTIENRVLERLDCLDFVDDSSGWLGGDEGIYHTEDGGKTLQKDKVVSGYIYDIVFPTQNQGWLVCREGIWRTKDGGKKWQKTQIDVKDGGLLDIDVLRQKGWVVGWESSKGIVCSTEDEGKNFRKVEVEEDLSGVSFVTEDMGWVVGSNGAIFVTEDGGETWQKQESGTDKYLSDVLFLSEKEGWAVGQDGIILHTTNGGDSWVQQKPSSKEQLNKIVYTGSDYLLAIGDWSTILRYQDESLSQYSNRFAVSDLKLRPITWGRIKNCLYQNYPNPFNPETWIPFSIANQASVTIQIHNLKGQLVKEINLGNKEPGLYLSREKAAYWDGRNQSGEQVSSGIYYYSIFAPVCVHRTGRDDFLETRKMILIK